MISLPRRRRLTPRVVHLVLAALLAISSDAAGQPTDASGLEITPSRVEQDLAGREFSIPILIVNHEEEPQRVTLSVSGLGHDLDGNPQFLEPAIATEVIDLSLSEVVLAPEERADFTAEGAIPESARSLYATVVAQFESVDAPADAGLIESRTRVASLLLFRGPQPWRQTAEVVDVSLVPGERKRDPMTVFAAVEDTGNVHIRPTGRIRIVQGRRVLDVVQLTGQTILPGFARRLTGTWKPPRRLKLEGRVDLHARIFDPDAEGSGFVEFTDGVVQRPGASITNLVARDEQGPLVEFILTNTGTIPLSPDISISISQDDQVEDSTEFAQAQMAPGAQEIVEWRPDVGTGVFLVNAEVSFEDQVLAKAATGLKIEDTGLPLWAIVVGALFLLLLLLGLFLLLRKRKSKEDDEASSGGAGEPVPADGSTT